MALILSFGPDLALFMGALPFEGVTAERVLALAMLHLVAASIIVATLLRVAPVPERI